MTFDPTKPVRLRSGIPARILCTDLKNSVRPIVAAWTDSNGNEAVVMRRADGRIYLSEDDPYDLVNVPETVVRYLNVYPGCTYPNLEDALKFRHSNALTTLKLTLRDGKVVEAEPVE